jgi:hypothetical protein
MFRGALKMAYMTAPGTPATGFGTIYFKSNGIAYSKNAAGTEAALGTTDPLWGHNASTNITPITASDALLLHAGSTLGWGTASPGTTDTTIARVSAGLLKLGGLTGGPGGLQFLETTTNGANYTGWKAPASLAGNTQYIMPLADATSAGQGLTSDASLTTSWRPFAIQLATNITASSIVGTAGATAFTFTGEGSKTVAASRLSVGSVVKITIAGTVTTDSDGAETMQHVFTLGNKTLYDTGALDVHGTSVTASPWIFTCEVTELTAGANGTFCAVGNFTYRNGTAAAAVYPFVASLTSFDTTATADLVDTLTWGTGDASPDVCTMKVCNVSYNNVD